MGLIRGAAGDPASGNMSVKTYTLAEPGGRTQSPYESLRFIEKDEATLDNLVALSDADLSGLTEDERLDLRLMLDDAADLAAGIEGYVLIAHYRRLNPRLGRPSGEELMPPLQRRLRDSLRRRLDEGGVVGGVEEDESVRRREAELMSRFTWLSLGNSPSRDSVQHRIRAQIVVNKFLRMVPLTYEGRETLVGLEAVKHTVDEEDDSESETPLVLGRGEGFVEPVGVIVLYASDKFRGVLGRILSP